MYVRVCVCAEARENDEFFGLSLGEKRNAMCTFRGSYGETIIVA